MSLYVQGYGNVSREELEIRAACRAQDSDLVFRRSDRSGNYTLYQRMQRDSEYVKNWEAADLEQGDLFPLRAWPNKQIPSRDEVVKWLWESDRERGDLLEKVNRKNAKIRAAKDADVKEEAHERAVFLEHAFRMDGIDTGRSVSLPNDGKRRRTFG